MELVDTASLIRKYQGAGQEELDDFLVRLRAEGVPISEAIIAVYAAYHRSLGEAKRIVVGHPSWAPIAEASRPIQEAARRAFLRGTENESSTETEPGDGDDS